MNDMRPVIVPKSDQINADSLLSGPMTIKITEVNIRPGTEQPVSIHFDGDDGKPYKPCKSMAKVMVNLWGPDANEYIGRSMTLYCDPKVLWGGMAVGGIRISHMSHLASAHTMALTATKGNKKPFTVKPLATEVDKASAGVRDLIQRIAAADSAGRKTIEVDAAVKTQRAWLEKNRPELAAQVTAALSADAGGPIGDIAPPAEPDLDAPDPRQKWVESTVTRFDEAETSAEMFEIIDALQADRAILAKEAPELDAQITVAVQAAKMRLSGGAP